MAAVRSADRSDSDILLTSERFTSKTVTPEYVFSFFLFLPTTAVTRLMFIRVRLDSVVYRQTLLRGNIKGSFSVSTNSRYKYSVDLLQASEAMVQSCKHLVS